VGWLLIDTEVLLKAAHGLVFSEILSELIFMDLGKVPHHTIPTQDAHRLSVPLSPVGSRPRISSEQIPPATTIRSRTTTNPRSPTIASIKEANRELKSPNRELKSQTTRRDEWRAPIAMVVFLLCGITSSISHHLYYQYFLDGKQVGDDGSQQWALRSA